NLGAQHRWPRPNRGDAFEVRQHLAPLIIDAEHPRRAIEPDTLEMTQQTVHRACPCAGWPPHRVPHADNVVDRPTCQHRLGAILTHAAHHLYGGVRQLTRTYAAPYP